MKLTIVLALVALFALSSAYPQVSVVDSPNGVQVVDNSNPDRVQVVDGQGVQVVDRPQNMSSICIGFVCAIILAVLVIIWAVYCMFCRERHKSEQYQYNISDLKHKYEVEKAREDDDQPQEVERKQAKELSAGIFILPSRQQHGDNEYEKRPDYPEGSVPIVQSGTEDLIKMLNESAKSTNVGFEIDSNSQYHSEV